VAEAVLRQALERSGGEEPCKAQAAVQWDRESVQGSVWEEHVGGLMVGGTVHIN